MHEIAPRASEPLKPILSVSLRHRATPNTSGKMFMLVFPPTTEAGGFKPPYSQPNAIRTATPGPNTPKHNGVRAGPAYKMRLQIASSEAPSGRCFTEPLSSVLYHLLILLHRGGPTIKHPRRVCATKVDSLIHLPVRLDLNLICIFVHGLKGFVSLGFPPNFEQKTQS